MNYQGAPNAVPAGGSEAEVDLFASKTLTHCPLWFSLSEPTSLLGQDALAPLASPWNRLTTDGCLAFLLAVASANRVSELHALSIARDICVRILMDLGLPFGPTPHFFLRGFQLFTSISLSIWQFSPHSQGWRNCILMLGYFVLFRI